MKHCKGKLCSSALLIADRFAGYNSWFVERNGLHAFDLVCAYMFLAFVSLKVFQQLLVARAHLIVGALFAVLHCRKPLAGKKSLARL